MKINKIKDTILVENLNLTEDTDTPAEKARKDELRGIEVDPISNLKDDSVDEIAAAILASGDEEDEELDAQIVDEHAEMVANLAKIIKNPYGTAQLGKVEEVLQASLEAAIADKRAGINSSGAYPNVIIYGLAGFGKTAKVKQFCRDHNLNLFECDAKGLDVATTGGIPYPTTNKKGELVQTPVASNYWDGLNEPNTILYLDELNRAHGSIRGTLLTLINEHILPMTTTDKKTGKVTNTKFFKNVLFTVISINPADDIFQDNQRLDPAEVSRNIAIIEQGPEIRDYLRHLTKVYTAIDNNPYLAPDLKARYAGQFDIAKTLLSNSGFSFDNANDVRTVYWDETKIGNYLNYRTFLGILRVSDGTKASYLKRISNSGLSSARKLMIENILKTYTDKVTVGNNLFKTQAPTARSLKTADAIADALNNLEKTFN